MPARRESGAPVVVKRKAKRKPYVRPRIEAQPGPVSSKERKVIKKAEPLVERSRTEVRRAVGRQRPAPRSQAGPNPDSDRQRAARAKTQKPYQQAVKTARKAGLREARRQYLKRKRPPGVFTDTERTSVDDFKQKLAKVESERGHPKVNPYATAVGRDIAGKAIKRSPLDVTKAVRLASTPYQVGRATVEDPAGVGKGTARALKDTVVNTPASLVKTVTDPKGALKEIADDYSRRYGPLVEGDTKGFRERIKDEGALGEALDVAGVASVGSKAVASAAKVAKRGRKALAEDEPATVPGTNIVERRRSSRGAAGQVVRKQRYRRKLKKARKKYREADEAQAAGAPTEDVLALRREGAEKDPRRVPEKRIRKRYDAREALAESRRRVNRAKAVKAADRALGKDAEGGLLVAQRVVAPDRESIRQYIRQLESQHKQLRTPAKRAANVRLRKRLEALAKVKDPEKFAAAAERYADVVAPMQKELVRRGVLDASQERMAKLIPYARQEMGAKWNREADRLEIDGRSVKAREIEAHMRQHGVDPADVAYVTQAPGQRGARNFYQSWQSPKGITSGKRTGEATVKGTFDLDPEVGKENAARMQSLIDSHNEYSEFVKENGFRQGGKVKTFATAKQAQDFIRDLQATPAEKGGKLTPSAYEWRAVPTRPQFGPRSHSEGVLDQVDDLTAKDAVDRALRGEGDGKYVLVLDEAAKQMGQHMRVLDPTSTGRAMRVGNQAFRGAVLSTSPSWVMGNIVEGLVRAGVAKAGPADARFARRVLKEVEKTDPAMAEEMLHRIGSGHFGMQELQSVHTTAKSFQGSAFAPVARALGTLRRVHGPKQIANAWGAYTRFVFGANGVLESQLRMAMAGQAMKELLATDNVITGWTKAVDQAARGLKNTNEQVEVADWVRRAYGKYEAFSPGERKLIAQYTPFVAWTLNAIKFLGIVLPKDHPVLTAALAANTRAWGEWRKQEGLDLLPGYLLGSVPSGDKLYRAARYTPFGFGGDPIETVGGALLPQVSGAWMASKGLDWKGEPLNDAERTDDVNEGQRIKAGVLAMLQATVPVFGQLSRGIDKEGSPVERAGQVLNPLPGSPRQDPELAKAFARKEPLKQRLDELYGQGYGKTKPKGTTPEFDRVYAQVRAVDGQIYRLSKGAYGQKPSGSSSGGAGWDQFREGAGAKAKSGWDAFR